MTNAGETGAGGLSAGSKGRKILLIVVSGMLGLLVVFMSVIYLFQDELQSYVLKEIKRQLVVAQPVGYTEEQVNEILDRYSTLIDTIQVDDSISLQLGEAFGSAFEDQKIDSLEAGGILMIIRTMTDPLGPYRSGMPEILNETSDDGSSAEDDTD